MHPTPTPLPSHRAALAAFDKDGDGLVSVVELRLALLSHGEAMSEVNNYRPVHPLYLSLQLNTPRFINAGGGSSYPSRRRGDGLWLRPVRFTRPVDGGWTRGAVQAGAGLVKQHPGASGGGVCRG